MSEFFDSKRPTGSLHIVVGVDCRLDVLMDSLTIESKNFSLFEKTKIRPETIEKGNLLKINLCEHDTKENDSFDYYRLIKPLKGFCHR